MEKMKLTAKALNCPVPPSLQTVKICGTLLATPSTPALACNMASLSSPTRSSLNSAAPAAISPPTHAAIPSPLPLYLSTKLAIAIFCTRINAVSPNVLNGNPCRTLYASEIRYELDSSKYERKERPSADCELSSLRSCGILTMEEAPMMPMPRPLEMASLTHSVAVKSTL